MNTTEEREEYRDQDPPPPPPASPAQGAAPHVAPTYPADTRRRRGFPYKSPVLATFLSFFPGLGQVYIGYYQRGFTHAVIVAATITALAGGLGELTPLFGFLLAFFWIYNIIDAGRRALLYNQAVDGGSSIEMPRDMKLGRGGSMVGGVLLVVIGVILLMYTRFDVYIPLRWLEDWWPLGAVGLGAYLIYKSITNRNRDGS
jgi:hypothetical protein